MTELSINLSDVLGEIHSLARGVVENNVLEAARAVIDEKKTIEQIVADKSDASAVMCLVILASIEAVHRTVEALERIAESLESLDREYTK